MQKTLITGVDGFIFSNYIQFFPNNIVGIDKFSKNKVAKPDCPFYVGNVADAHFMEVVFKLEKPDLVIHGAAESFVDYAIDSAAEFIHSNVLGTQVVVDMCLKYGVEKLLYISTDEVYGQLGPTDKAFTEESLVVPRNPYSATKAAGEMLVRAAGETHGLKYNITRSCNNYGPRQPVRNLIPVIIHNILNNKPVPIYGTGAQIREWIYVQDNCEAVNFIMNNGINKETYNISSGQEINNLELFYIICEILDKGKELLQFVEERPGHDFRYAMNGQKLEELGWSPKLFLYTGLEKTVQWYIDNILAL